VAEQQLHQVQIERNLLIPMSDGATLCADLVRPAGQGPFPALLSFYPYHKDDFIGAGNEATLRYFAANGYAHLLIDFRGVGGSSGIAWEMMERGEGRDGAEAVEWIARQNWCDGNVGMWGISYGGISSLKTAAEAPPHLKAIVPIQGSTDIYNDFLYPGGCLNCLGAFGAWGSFMLAMNLMPPTNVDPDGRWYKVWMERLESGKPYVFPWIDHPAHDEYWQRKVVDPSKIKIPAFIVGGWRDIFPEAMPSVFARLPGPKKLLMGPWMHTMPDTAVNDPVDFIPEMKRWFDYWLRGDKNGIADEPPVTIFVQGANQWRNEREFPPARTTPATFFLGARGALGDRAEREEGAENYAVDPTVGMSAGLWDPTGLGVGMPVDQTADDVRSLTYTTEPLANDIEITGAGEALFYAALVDGGDANIVAKLCDVDSGGVSTLITTGWLKASLRAGLDKPQTLKAGEVYEFRVPLFSTSYLVKRGDRLRVSISGADFPHVWPSRANAELRFFHGGTHASKVTLPVVPAQKTPVNGPIPRPVIEPRVRVGVMTPRHKIETDMVAGTIAVTTGQKTAMPLPTGGSLEMDHTATAKVFRTRPDQATVEGDTTIKVRVPSLGDLEVKTESWFSHSRMTLSGSVTLDGRRVFERTWQK
jgi:putative CocE/NonD family hydrolase